MEVLYKDSEGGSQRKYKNAPKFEEFISHA
jgi:hypothetical protein